MMCFNLKLTLTHTVSEEQLYKEKEYNNYIVHTRTTSFLSPWTSIVTLSTVRSGLRSASGKWTASNSPMGSVWRGGGGATMTLVGGGGATMTLVAVHTIA